MVHSFESRMLMSALLLCCAIVQVASSYKLSDPIPCPLSLSKVYGKTCSYKFVGRQSTDRSTAWRFCIENGGKLVAIENGDAQMVLVENIKRLLKSKLLDNNVCSNALWTSGAFNNIGIKGAFSPSNEWIWYSQSVRINFNTYTHWASPQGNGGCVAMMMDSTSTAQGDWIALPCTSYACFICEYKGSLAVDAFEPQCPVSLLRSYEICQFKFVYKPMDWETAREYCINEEGDLAVVDNKDVRDVFASSIQTANLSSTTNTKCQLYVWTSGRFDNTTNEWRWQSGDLPIDNNDLNSRPVPDSCLATSLLPKFDSWATIPCNMSVCFICEYKKIYLDEPRLADTTPAPAAATTSEKLKFNSASTLSFRCLLPKIMLMMTVLAAI